MLPMLWTENRIARLLDGFWPFEDGGEAAMAPRMDVSEDADHFYCRFDLPGVEEKEIQVTFEGGELSVRAERCREAESKDLQVHRSERAYGAFVRTLSLPSTVDGERVSAAYRSGVLTVTLPKRAESKARAIQVKGA